MTPAGRDRIWLTLCHSQWGFGWVSNVDKKGFPFWHRHFAGNAMPDHKSPEMYNVGYAAQLRNNNETIWGMWQWLSRSKLAGHTLLRCYANGMTYGCDGTTHTDSTDPDSYTVVYYANPEWDRDWGGETALFPPGAPAFWALPQPGRFLMFNGTIPHVARGVSRSCPVMRVTLMFKTRLPRV